MIMHYTAYDPAVLPQYNNRYRRDHKYYPLVASFDTETTNYKNRFAFMYIWTFGIGSDVVYGRSWDDFIEWLRRLRAWLHLYIDHKMVVMVHNLKYDFAFFCREMQLDGPMIARSKNDVIMCTVNDVFEFRCSYAYTERPLDQMGEEIGIPKITGYDYTKIRHHRTALTDDEILYAATDAKILTEYFRRELKQCGGVHRLPLTATQRVKKMISGNLSASEDRSNRIMMGMIKKRQLKPGYQEDARILKRLRCAFFGGFNYCTTIYKNQTIKDCDGYDRTSAYIYEILIKKFPADRFERMPLPADRSMHDLISGCGIYRNMATLTTIEFKNLRTILPDVGFLPAYTKNYLSHTFVDRRSMVSKKIMQIDHCVLTLTDIDLYLLDKYYTYDNYRIIDVYGTRYGCLPEYIISAVMDLWKKKKAAKAWLRKIKETRQPTAEEQAEYERIKSNLNRIYGIFVQDPIRTNYVWDPAKMTVSIDPEDARNTKNVQWSPVLYQWGVWVSAHARKELLSVFGALAMDREGAGGYRYNHRVMYSDTDSIKGFDLDDTIIAEYNKTVKARVNRFCERRGLDPDLLDGLGEFESEHYPALKCIGQKQYAFVDHNNNFVYHVSGLARPEKGEDGQYHCYFDRFETNDAKMDAFRTDMQIDAADSGIYSTVYGRTDIDEQITDDDGITANVKTRSWALLIPAPYHQSRELSEELDSYNIDRVRTVAEKFFGTA